MEDREMDFKVFFTTFWMIFLAEVGDKTQLATLAFAAENKSRLTVFLGSAAALVLTSLLAVLLGSLVSRAVPASYLRIAAGSLFVILGGWMLLFPGK
jgi:Ca2+/H+ antiporter, TMEM165/GDT1 family